MWITSQGVVPAVQQVYVPAEMSPDCTQLAVETGRWIVSILPLFRDAWKLTDVFCISRLCSCLCGLESLPTYLDLPTYEYGLSEREMGH